MKAPCQTSPAANVSTAVIPGAGIRRSVPPSRQAEAIGAQGNANHAPRELRRRGESFAGQRRSRRVGEAGLRIDDIVGELRKLDQRFARSYVAIEDGWYAAPRGRRKHGARAFRPTHIGKHRLTSRDIGEWKPRGVAVERGIIEGADEAFAEIVDQNCGRRRDASRDAAHRGHVYALSGQLFENALAEWIGADSPQ